MLQINSAKQKIILDASERIINDFVKLDFVKEYIPCISFSAINDNIGNVFTFNLIDDKEVGFIFSEKGAVLKYPHKELGLMNDLVTVIDYCFEYIRNIEDIHCVHGSSSAFGNKGVVLIGAASGIGKSTVNYHLIKNGFTFVSDEKTLIDGKNIIGGNTKISFNKDLIKKNHDQELINTLIKRSNFIADIPIKLFVQPVTNKNGDLYIDKWEPLKAEFHVYEELSRKIRGISRRIYKFTYPLNSIDTQSLADARSIKAKRISTEIPFYAIYGDPEDVAGEIVNILRNL